MTKITLRSERGFGRETSFNTESKKETVVYRDGIAGKRTKISNYSEEVNRTIEVPVALFNAHKKIYKCNQETSKNTEKICDEGKILYVIGTPNGDNDPNDYVIFSERYGMAKRAWNEITMGPEGGVVTHIETRVTCFDVPMIGYNTGKGDQELFNLIILPKGMHAWISDEWVKERNFITEYRTVLEAQVGTALDNQPDEGLRGMEELHSNFYQPFLAHQVPIYYEEGFPQPNQPYQLPFHAEEGFPQPNQSYQSYQPYHIVQFMPCYYILPPFL